MTARLVWYEHTAFDRELKKLAKKYPAVNVGLKSVKKLLERQFDPINPEEVIAPGKLHRVYQNAIWTLWKVEVVLPKSGLKPSQWPRMWFVVYGNSTTMLAIASHTDNYDNNEVDRIAIGRATDTM